MNQIRSVTPVKWGWQPTSKMKSLARTIPPGRALDLGCGCGGNSIWLAEHGFRVIAIDKPGATVCIEERLRHSTAGNAITVTSLDLRNTFWSKDKYDLILAINILHFFSSSRLSLILRALKDSLNPNGVLFIRMLNEPQSSESSFNQQSIPKTLKRELFGLEILEFKQYQQIDAHPPIGKHRHTILDLIARQPCQAN